MSSKFRVACLISRNGGDWLRSRTLFPPTSLEKWQGMWALAAGFLGYDSRREPEGECRDHPEKTL